MGVVAEPGSFRDPSGFIFYRENTLYRQVQEGYRDEYDLLMASGLYSALTDAGLLVPHVEESASVGLSEDAYRILRPEQIPFISYPYEWAFSQLRDAALLTLKAQMLALDHGMTLKDASGYNVQFRRGAPILIDTLSFQKYVPGTPWIAYRQFCQHFLAPLALMSLVDIRMSGLLRTNLDGVPLDLASRLLPAMSRLNPGLLMHVHLHAASQKRYEDRPSAAKTGRGEVSLAAVRGLVDSLESTVKGLHWNPAGTAWSDYYSSTNYSSAAMNGKEALVKEMLDLVTPAPGMAWDLGANTGVFSRLASERGAETIAWDVDPAAVEKNYIGCRSRSDERMLPLLLDLTNPSPAQGWDLNERRSLVGRGPADVVMSLALVHHLTIGNNVPLDRVASFLHKLGRWLIIEFVPKSDSQVQRLLSTREDIFPGYTEPDFCSAFSRQFEIVRESPVPESVRTLYLMQAR